MDIQVMERPVTYHAELASYDVRKRKGILSNEIVGVVHAYSMTEALVAARNFYPGYWFVTPTTQRRPYEKAPLN